MFNVVTTLIVRDGLEVVVGCYFAYLLAGRGALRYLPIAFAVALTVAIIGHILISELDEHFRPFELAIDLAVPALIMAFCLTHLPKKRVPKTGTYFAALLVLGETAEVAISTLEQDGTEIRNGVISGGLILAAIILAVWLTTRWFGSSVKDIVRRHMTTVMALLNLGVGVFGLYVLSNVREPLDEYEAMGWWPLLAAIYSALLLWVIIATVYRLAKSSGTVPHPTPDMQ